MKRIEILQKKCDDNGISLHEAFRQANVPEATINNWRRKEPDAFDTHDRVTEAIDKLIADKGITDSEREAKEKKNAELVGKYKFKPSF